MVPQGRCAGCGTSGELRRVKTHVMKCADFAQLYCKDPASVLDPGPEHARWLAEDRDREHAADLEFRTADTVRRVRASQDRFAPVDLLGG